MSKRLRWTPADAGVDPIWLYNGTMPVTLSIKNVPDRVVEILRERARENRRSLQGELLALVERDAAQVRRPAMTVTDLYNWARAQDFRGTGNSADDIRRSRDERAAHIEALVTPRTARRRRNPRARARGRR